MSSIYVPICSMDDLELIPTIKSIFKNSSKNTIVNVGLRLISDDDNFISYVKEYVRNNGHIKFKFDKIDKTNARSLLGIGRGRHEAMSFYNNEDYILQIDSHSLFAKNWDIKLINAYRDAKKYTGLDKIIITAYAGYYTYNMFNKRVFGAKDIKDKGRLRYINFSPFQILGDFAPGWSDVDRKIDDKFVPIPKLSANFLFTDGRFAKDTGLFKEAVFFEEEVIQTLELAKKGYSFIYPNLDYPVVAHSYTKSLKSRNNKRKVLADYGKYYDSFVLAQRAKSNYIQYMKDPANQEIIERYNKYVGEDFDIRRAVNETETGIPKSFII